MYLPSNISHFLFLETVLYSAFFPKESILLAKDAICETSQNVIDLFYMNTTTTTDHMLKLLYSECATPVLVNVLNRRTPRRETETKSSTKVFLVNALDQVDAFMDVIDEFRFEKDKRKYFVIVERIDATNHHQVQWLYYLFAKFWQKQVLNVVVIFHEHSLQMYTYQLLADDGGSSNVSMPTAAMLEQTFNLRVMNITHYDIAALFFNKLTNLQGRKLVVTMFPLVSRAYLKKDGSSYTGIDGNVAELIRSR